MCKQLTIYGILGGAGCAMYPALAGYVHAFKKASPLSLTEALLLMLVIAALGGIFGCAIGWWLDRRKKSK